MSLLESPLLDRPSAPLHPGQQGHSASLSLGTGAPRVPLVPGQVTLLEMGQGFHDVRHQLVLDVVAQGRTVLHIVGGNRLLSTGLARAALGRRLDPVYVLRSSLVARAFTAYQLSVLIEETLPATLAERDDVALALVSDPLDLYADEDVPRAEGRVLLDQAAAALTRTAQTAERPLLVVQGPGAPLDLLARLRAEAGEHVLVRERTRDRLVVLPLRGAEFTIAEPGPQQTRLARFLEGVAHG